MLGFRSVELWWWPPDKAGELDRLLMRAATLAIALLIAHSFVEYPLRTGAIMAIFAFSCALLIEPLAVAEDATMATAEPSRWRCAAPAGGKHTQDNDPLEFQPGFVSYPSSTVPRFHSRCHDSRQDAGAKRSRGRRSGRTQKYRSRQMLASNLARRRASQFGGTAPPQSGAAAPVQSGAAAALSRSGRTAPIAPQSGAAAPPQSGKTALQSAANALSRSGGTTSSRSDAAAPSQSGAAAPSQSGRTAPSHRGTAPSQSGGTGLANANPAKNK